MNDDFSSSALQMFLKNAINHSKLYHYRLRTLANCGVVGEIRNGVHVLSNGDETKILGVKMCNHSWACPVCTARKMAKYSRRVGAAIDALASQGYAAAMITFTFFHTAKLSCATSYKLLRRIYELFTKNGVWKRAKKSKDPNKEKEYYASGGYWNQFVTTFDIKHTIKTLEVTYGKHGWHPHIHMLIFVKKDQLQELANWEEKLNIQWSKTTDRVSKALLTEKDYEVMKFLESKETRDDAAHKSIWISKTNDGKVVQMHSGDYICGWGGNNELTGTHLKTARKNNMTPLQMLDMAFDLRYSNPTKSKKLVRKYLQFAYTVIKYRIHRIDFSRTGLNAIVQNWINSEGYKELYKKKCAELRIKPYKTICWLTCETWQKVCYINDYLMLPIIPLIKRFATYEDGYNLICELFQTFNLSPPLKQHPIFDWAEPFNEKIYAQTQSKAA